MRVGVAGLGFMGAVHLRAWQSIAGASVRAIMSGNERKLAGEIGEVSGNLDDAEIGGKETRIDFTGVAKYKSFEELIQEPEIDAVDICLPTHLHVESALAALRAGKHVLIEKPLALDGESCRVVLREAEVVGKTLMVGHVLRFFPAYAAMSEILQREGNVRFAHFRRRCAAPGWSGWLGDASKSGGAILDLLIHDIDYCLSLWGPPESVRCFGALDLTRGIDLSHCELRYSGVGPVVISGGWHHPKTYPFTMSFTVSTDAGTLDWVMGSELKQYMANGEHRVVPTSTRDAFAAELEYFADCVSKGKKPDQCPPEQSMMAVEIGQLLRESRERGGKEIQWAA